MWKDIFLSWPLPLHFHLSWGIFIISSLTMLEHTGWRGAGCFPLPLKPIGRGCCKKHDGGSQHLAGLRYKKSTREQCVWKTPAMQNKVSLYCFFHQTAWLPFMNNERGYQKTNKYSKPIIQTNNLNNNRIAVLGMLFLHITPCSRRG